MHHAGRAAGPNAAGGALRPAEPGQAAQGRGTFAAAMLRAAAAQAFASVLRYLGHQRIDAAALRCATCDTMIGPCFV